MKTTTQKQTEAIMKLSEPLTWNDLADMYPGTARTKPMEVVFDYFERQKDKFHVTEDGSICKILP